MAKTYLATQAEVSAVEQKVDTANTAINATDTGLTALDTKIEGLVTKTDTSDTKISSLETTVGDETAGLVKAVNDIDASINGAGGIDERVTDLEAGGTTTIKFRTHSTSGTYEDGEVVQRNGLIYKANAAIDGSGTPIPFVGGTTGQTWTLLGYPEEDIQEQIDKKAEKAFNINPTSASVAVVDTNGNLLYSPTVSVDELDYLDGVTSKIQTQLDAKIGQSFGTGNPEQLCVAMVGTDGRINYATNIGLIEVGSLDGVTSSIQTQLNGKITAPSHFTITQYNSNQGVVLGTSEPNLVFGTGSNDEVYISGGGSVRPLSATQDLGNNNSTQRWQTLYLKNNPNVSSDSRLKTDLKEIPDELLDVWFQYVKPTTYELISNQGKQANRIEVGLIAQDVIAAFEAAGLDWHEWNVVCVKDDFDNQDDALGKTDEIDYYSLNYTACQLIESMAIRRKLGI